MSQNNPIFWFAPLHGITYHYMRNVLFSHVVFFDQAIAPFVPAHKSDKLNVKKWIDLDPENNPFIPIIPQLMGNDPDAIVDTILAIQSQFGYNQINWNIGCPMNQIVRKQRGCGVMPHPEWIENVVNRVTQKTKISFSIKMRLGLNSPKEGDEIIKRLNQYPLDFLVIHPRLGIQQYEGEVDLDSFETMILNSNQKIVYSGDINNLNTFQNLQKRFPQIQNWMLGRGVLRDPFLVEELKMGISLNDEQKLIRFKSYYYELQQSLFQLKSEQDSLPKLKELWKYFAQFFQLTEKELLSILRINHIQEFKEFTEIAFTKYLNDRYT